MDTHLRPDPSPPTNAGGGLFLPFPWKQGEHVAIIGRTGTGKTRLASELLAARRYTIAFVTKADPSSKFLPNDLPQNKHLKRVNEISATDPRYERYVVEPKPDEQQREGLALLRRAWKDGAWTVYVDEEYYVEKQLGLGSAMTMLLTQSRSKGISVVMGMQRPAWVSQFALSEPTHVICFQLGTRDDLKKVTGNTSEKLERPIRDLTRFEAVWYYRPENRYAIVDRDRLRGRVTSPGEPDQEHDPTLARER